jgi:hypothetical protein
MVVLAACSSDPPASSGVTPTKLLNTLSASELDQLCTFRTEIENAPRSVTCGTSKVMIEDKASCVSAFGNVDIQCQATVSDAENCFHSFNADPCGHGDGACTALFVCILPTA